MTNEQHFPKTISQREFDYSLFTNLSRILSPATFLRVHSNSKEVSHLSWQNTYPNFKTTCHMKLKFFLWTKFLEYLLLAKYLIFVAATLKNFLQVSFYCFLMILAIFNNNWKWMFNKMFSFTSIATVWDTNITEWRKYRRKKVIMIKKFSPFSLSAISFTSGLCSSQCLCNPYVLRIKTFSTPFSWSDFCGCYFEHLMN